MTTLHHFSQIELLPEGSEFTDSKGESFRKQLDGYALFNSPAGFLVELSEVELPITLDQDVVDPNHRKLSLTEETRTTSATGGQKGKKDEELGAVDPTALRILARVAAFGGKKYERSNYLKGYDWSLSFDALQRHALAFWEGEDLDPESGLPHTAHISWHALALTSFLTRGIGTDDRFKGSGE
jgi:hypothetical protein